MHSLAIVRSNRLKIGGELLGGVSRPRGLKTPTGRFLTLLVGLTCPSLAAVPNHAPSVKDLALTTSEDVRAQGAVAAVDPDGDALTFKLVRKPTHGQATVERATGALGYLPAKDFNGEDSFSVEASDGRLTSKSEVKVHVAPVNDAPTARPVSLSTREDTPVRGASSASDVDGDALTYRVARAPAHGVASVDARLGALSYQPQPNANGSDTFAVEVSDGTLSATFEVNVTIAPVNDAPVAAAGAFSLDEDTKLDGTVAAVDVDGDAVTFRVSKRPLHGALQLNAKTGVFAYVPERDWHGADAFAFEASDGRLKSEATITLEVRPVNDAPVASPLSLVTREDTLVRGSSAARDVDGDALTYRIARPPAHGTASVEAKTGAVTYQGAADWSGTDAFAVEVSDGALIATSEVTVAVSAVNDAPVLAPVSFTFDEDGRLDETLLGHDVDGDALTYQLASRPVHGTATIEPATGKLGYVPAKDFFGDDSLVVEVSDGQLKASAPVQLHVRAVNDAPVARPLSLTTLEDTPVRGNVIATDVDSALSYRVSTAPAHGEARVDAAGLVTYQPAPDFNGADVFVVEVSDGELTAKSDVTVSVAPVNDAPVAPNATFTLDEDTRLDTKLELSDVDGDPLTARLLTNPRHGVATIESATGRFTYVPMKDFNGDDGLTFEVSDGKLKVTSTVTLHVTAVNDAPVASPLALSTLEDTAVRGGVIASDVDHDVLSYRLKTPPSHGEASVDARTGAVVYAPSPDSNGPDAFVVEVSDGKLTAGSAVSVMVTPVDDPPVVHAATLETLEDTAADGMLPATEADGEKLTFRLLSTPRLGTAVLVDPSTGAWRFSPFADLNGDDQVAFDVRDGKTTVPGVMKIHVVAVNDAPTVAGLELTCDEDRPVVGQLEGKDVDGDALTYSIETPSGSGRAVMLDAATGRLRFEPARDFNGRTSFTVVASDGKLKSAPATVTVTVKAQNDAPVAADAKLSLNEDEVLHGKLGATDVDGDPLVFRVVDDPVHGLLSILEPTTGAFEYMPAANYFGSDAFTYSVTDPSMATSTGKVRLTINPVNDPPVAVSETISAPYRGTITGRLKGYDRESRTVTFSVIGKPAHGQFRLIDQRTGEFTFSTDGSSSSDSVVRFVVSDGELKSQPAELRIQMQNM